MKIWFISFVVISTSIYESHHQCIPSVTTVSGNLAPKEVCSGYLILEDNFNDLNTSRWKHEITLGGGGKTLYETVNNRQPFRQLCLNWEFQWYTDNCENSIAENGILKIRPTLTTDFLGEGSLTSQTVDLGKSCTNEEFFGCLRKGTLQNILNPIRSAKLSTIDSFAFKYGRIEIRAKLPAGDWIKSTISMSPKQNIYGQWPRSGEIDIIESRGNRQLVLNNIYVGVQQVASTLHWGLDPANNGFSRTHWEKNKHEFHQNFHTYEMLWTPDLITFKVDGEQIGSVSPPRGGFWQLGDFGRISQANMWSGGSKLAPFDNEFYLIINLSVGGVSEYFPDTGSNPGKKPWSNKSPKASTDFWNGKKQWLRTWNLGYNEDSHLQIDYVKIYAL